MKNSSYEIEKNGNIKRSSPNDFYSKAIIKKMKKNKITKKDLNKLSKNAYRSSHYKGIIRDISTNNYNKLIDKYAK